MPSDARAKHRRIFQELHLKIATGQFAPGEQIPTESELAEAYGASRPTVARAIRELERGGFVVRRRGAGTFVADRRSAPAGLLGLIVPRPGEGIFAPMCDAVVREARKAGYGVLLAGSLMHGADVSLEREEAFCEQLLTQRVAGVFFGPLDVRTGQADINTQIAERLDRSGIPVVLLDRDICDYPHRSRFDLIGVNNRRGGYLATSHLLRLGCRRIEFVTHGYLVSTATARIEGYRDALGEAGIGFQPSWVHRWNPEDRRFVRELIRPPHADAFVCVNDRVAASLMHNLAVLGVRVPDDVRLVGFDDIEAAARLPSPLTTVRQPAAEVGIVATRMLLERMADPSFPAREVALNCELIVRESCGARLSNRSAAAG